MFKRIMSKIKNSKGVSVTTEIVILIVVIVGIAVSVGNGLDGVFTGADGKGGMVKELGDFITTKFNGVKGTTP